MLQERDKNKDRDHCVTFEPFIDLLQKAQAAREKGAHENGKDEYTHIYALFLTNSRKSTYDYVIWPCLDLYG